MLIKTGDAEIINVIKNEDCELDDKKADKALSNVKEGARNSSNKSQDNNLDNSEK